MTKWNSIEVNKGGSQPDDASENNDDFVDDNELDNDSQDMDDDNEQEMEDILDDDVDLDAEDDEQEEEQQQDDDSDEDDEDEQEESRKPPQKKERSEKRIRELVAERNAERQRVQELERQLQTVETEGKAARKQSRENEKAAIDADIGRLETTIATANAEIKKAMENQDYDALAKANATVVQANVELMASKSLKRRLDSEKDEVETKPSKKVDTQQRKVQIPEIAEKWMRKNSWFNSDPALTGAALGIDAQLKREGYNPMSKDYYDEVDRRMAKFLPKQDKKAVRKKVPLVGESSKASPSVKVQITSKDRMYAQKMGISEKEYLKQKANYELNSSRNVETYKPIVITKETK